MNFVLDYPLDKLTPADYNPRKLAPDAFEKLQESLKTFGVVKPVILNGANGVLTAGHQRTRSMKAVGIKCTPAIILKQISLKDEIRFNLFHNSIETNKSVVKIKGADKIKFGYNFVDIQDVIIRKRDNATIVNEISKLLVKYGAWGSVIIDEEGNVIDNSDYAVASASFKEQLLVYKMKNEDVKKFLEYMEIDYGQYYYETLGIKAYNQVFCQMHRLETGGKSQKHSTTYENFVIPNINKSQRIVDFGAGECEYVNMLRKKGFKIYEYEPHYRKKGKNAIDIEAVVRFINVLNRDIKSRGLYDVVVLDSVLNSITSNEFEDYVLTACNALCNKDGVFYTGTRSLKSVERDLSYKSTREPMKRRVEFLDKDNFSATFRNGVWTLQKFNSVETLTELLHRYFYDVEVKELGASNIYGICKGPKKLSINQYSKALDIEFNMEYPNGFRHNKHEELVNTIIENIKCR